MPRRIKRCDICRTSFVTSTTTTTTTQLFPTGLDDESRIGNVLLRDNNGCCNCCAQKQAVRTNNNNENNYSVKNDRAQHDPTTGHRHFDSIHAKDHPVNCDSNVSLSSSSLLSIPRENSCLEGLDQKDKENENKDPCSINNDTSNKSHHSTDNFTELDAFPTDTKAQSSIREPESSLFENHNKNGCDHVISLIDDDDDGGGGGDEEEMENGRSMEEENFIEAGSEAGDDVHCTQLGYLLDTNSTGSDDESLVLTELVSRKKRQTLEIPDSVHEKETQKTTMDESCHQDDPNHRPIGEIQQQNNTNCFEDMTEADVSYPPATMVLLGSTKTCSNDKDLLRICSVCGTSLLHIHTWKGRINHLKRCAKQNGVSAQDIRIRIDEENMYNDNQNNTTSSSSPELDLPNSSSSPTKTNTTTTTISNPYNNSSPNGMAKESTTTECGCISQGSTKPSPPPPSMGMFQPHGVFKAAQSALDILMQGARTLAQASRRCHDQDRRPSHRPPSEIPSVRGKTTSGQKRPFSPGRYDPSTDFPTSIRSSCPAYKKITGTDFVVDGFHYAKNNWTENYFLSHFHSDHYGGITSHWNRGIIHCSEPTAKLVHSQLRVDLQFLKPLPMNQPIPIKTRGGINVLVTLIDANHCPGAVMMLFQVGNRHILHVGDFRWNRDAMLSSPNSPLLTFATGAARLDELYLDTTYCNPKYELPSQQDAIRATIQSVEKHLKEARSLQQEILFLFGAYTIGKERIYMAVAEHLQLKVYVDRRRFQILSQFGWPPERMALLTTQPDQSILWVVPLGHVGMKKLASYASVQIGRSSFNFHRVVGFRPTGWAMTSKPLKYKDGTTGSLIKTTTQGQISSCSVPYSEHSSFPELVDCLVALKPLKIIPTVSVSKAKEQVNLLLSHVAQK